MTSTPYGGTVNNTSGYSGPWPANAGNFVYTTGYNLPTARLSLTGTRPIYISNITAAYTSGPLSDVTIVVGGTETSGSHLFAASGTAFQLRFKFTSGGTLYFGRNTGNGLTTVRNRDATSVAGGLVGTVVWGQVATAPTAVTAIPGPSSGTVRVDFTPSSDNGSYAISNYTIQSSDDGGATWVTEATTTSGVNNLIAMAPGTYIFRVYATNAVGNSQASVSSAPVVPASGGGQRYDGAAFNPLTISRRFDGGAWIDLSTGKRFDGATFVDISN